MLEKSRRGVQCLGLIAAACVPAGRRGSVCGAAYTKAVYTPKRQAVRTCFQTVCLTWTNAQGRAGRPAHNQGILYKAPPCRLQTHVHTPQCTAYAYLALSACGSAYLKIMLGLLEMISAALSLPQQRVHSCLQQAGASATAAASASSIRNHRVDLISCERRQLQGNDITSRGLHQQQVRAVVRGLKSP